MNILKKAQRVLVRRNEFQFKLSGKNISQRRSHANNILKEASPALIWGKSIPAEGTAPTKALPLEVSWLERFKTVPEIQCGQKRMTKQKTKLENNEQNQILNGRQIGNDDGEDSEMKEGGGTAECLLRVQLCVAFPSSSCFPDEKTDRQVTQFYQGTTTN